MADPHLLKLNQSDNVAVALVSIAAGAEEEVGGRRLYVAEAVPAHHKVALTDLGAGETVRKYGFPIGRLTRPVRRGCWVHSHNLSSDLVDRPDYRYEPVPSRPLTFQDERTFDGYVRTGGEVGTRNEIWIVNTVGCVSRTAEAIARRCCDEFDSPIDGVFALTHPHGCSQLGADLEKATRIVSDLARHPNAGGVLVLGLGCEEASVESVLQSVGYHDRTRLRSFNSQEVMDEVEHGTEVVRQLILRAEQDRREERPLSDLVVGLECGGSDSLSGVTANPLVGRITDRITNNGGGAILTEVPEMFGAEQILMNRAVTEDVFREVVSLIDDFKRYFTDRGYGVERNPSPGNMDGGITTLEEKSLGAIRKGGDSRVTEVLRYGARKKQSGLSLLEAPGNDAVSSTALVASGATVLLFTTGRGTPWGSPVPTIKISSNTAVFEKKTHWFDFNAGSIADGTTGINDLEGQLLCRLLDVASGRVRARNEISGYRDIAIWKDGVTL